MKSSKHILTVCLLSFVASAALAAPPLADKVPENTIFYLGWAGRNLTFDGSLLGQMLKEPEVAAIFAGLKRAATVGIGDKMDGQAALDHAWEMAGIAWQKPMALALIDLSLMKQERPGPEGRPIMVSSQPAPVGAVLIDLGKDRAAFDNHLQKLLNLAGEELKITRATVGNVTYQSFATPVGPCGLGYVGDLFFACVGEKVPETIVAIAGGKQKPLAVNAKFVAAMKEVAAEQPQMAVYLDAARTYEVVDKLLAGQGPRGAEKVADFHRIIKALGIDGVTALAGAGNIVDRGVHEKVRIFTDAPHTGVLMLLSGKPLSPKALAGAPADADVVCAASLNPAKLLAELKRVAAEIEPKAAEEIEANLASASKELGVDIEKDLLAHIGDEWTLCSAGSLGGFITGTAVSVELKDPAKFAESLGKLEAFFKRMLGQEAPGTAPATRPRGRGPEIRSCKIGALEVHYVAISGGTITMWLGAVAPAWAIHNGRLHIAAFPQVVAAAATGSAEKPLTDSPTFAAVRKRVSPTPSILMYANTPGLLRKLYGVPLVGWTLMTNMIGREVGPALTPEMLPILPKIEKYLTPDICAVSADAKGITIESYGSGIGVGMIAGSPVGPALTTAMLLPPLSRARMLAKRSLSAANLKNIGMGCMMYQVEENQLPPDLIKLVEKNAIIPELLMSPNSGRKVRLDAKGKPIGPFDYVYLGSDLKKDDIRDPGGTILAYERPEINRYQGTNVLYADGHVTWVSMARFQRDLNRTKTFLANRAKAEKKKDF